MSFIINDSQNYIYSPELSLPFWDNMYESIGIVVSPYWALIMRIIIVITIWSEVSADHQRCPPTESFPNSARPHISNCLLEISQRFFELQIFQTNLILPPGVSSSVNPSHRSSPPSTENQSSFIPTSVTKSSWFELLNGFDSVPLPLLPSF